MSETFIKQGKELIKQAPVLVCLITVVGMFLYYLDRHEARAEAKERRDEAIAITRIKEFHAVQNDSITVMRELTRILAQQEDATEDLIQLIQSRQQTQ